MSEPQANDLFPKGQSKTLPEIPHRFMDKHQPESDANFLTRLFNWCYQNELDKPNQWFSEAEYRRLEDEIKNLRKEKDNAVYEWVDLQETLLAIKQHYERRPEFDEFKYKIPGVYATISKYLDRLGVLLNSTSLPKELDQKTCGKADKK